MTNPDTPIAAATRLLTDSLQITLENGTLTLRQYRGPGNGWRFVDDTSVPAYILSPLCWAEKALAAKRSKIHDQAAKLLAEEKELDSLLAEVRKEMERAPGPAVSKKGEDDEARIPD